MLREQHRVFTTVCGFTKGEVHTARSTARLRTFPQAYNPQKPSLVNKTCCYVSFFKPLYPEISLPRATGQFG
jgi:hypothetical protein